MTDPWYRSLRFRLAALLSVALLPIGIVAAVQTRSLAGTAQENAELALLALTEQAAAVERRALNVGRGASEVLAFGMDSLLADPALCADVMERSVVADETFSFAGFVPLSGIMDCASSGRGMDFSGTEMFRTRMADPRPTVTVNRDGPVSGTSVVILSTPAYSDAGTFMGYVTLSIPHNRLGLPEAAPERDKALELVTFNRDGDLLTSRGDPETAADLLPAEMSLADLGAAGRAAQTLDDRTGTPRIYTVTTIEAGQVYALGIWDRQSSVTGRTGGEIITSLFPALMWMAGLIVALIAVHQLVTRHLQVLGRQMALFTAARRLPDEGLSSDPPTEIRRIQRAFHSMTEALIRDEASLEHAVREKSVLVKEIHHRVKNNLQLISSIINMQIRDAVGPEAKSVLRRTQDRVLSMATIHRDLYQTNETGLVDVGHLIGEVIGKTIEMNPELDDLDLTLEIEDVWLYPDQAVPMSLLASEAATNALKHMPESGPDAPDRWLKVAFSKDAEGVCTFRTCNRGGPPGSGPRPTRGMGRKLIRAFATQLGAEVNVCEEDELYCLTVTFAAKEFAPLPGTY